MGEDVPAPAPAAPAAVEGQAAAPADAAPAPAEPAPAEEAAPEGPTTESNIVAINTIWTLLAAFLVFFMQAGFAMVETGLTRAKNAANIMMKNLMDFCFGSLAFWAIGYGIMFGADSMGLFGTDKFFLVSGDPSTSDGLWQFTYWMFQVVFAATAATIVSGAMAERTKFTSYLVYSVFISLFIYPIVGHWIWGGGWLAQRGFHDFAGSTVVHSVGGWSALAGAIILGPRLGKYGKDGRVNAIPGHNIPLAALGVFILWFGWFGFNPGSTTSGVNLSIATIAVTTNLAAAAGAITAMLTVWAWFGKPEATMALNGALAGLVAITAPCAVVSPSSAIIIGAIAGVLVVAAVTFIDRTLKIDDPVGAISVHGVCGSFGTLCVGLFAESRYSASAGLGEINGLFFGGGTGQLVTQLTGVVSVFFWTFAAMFLLFTVLKKTVGLRVSDEEQMEGLDVGEHGLEAYSGFQMKGD
ncbi:MAG: ammonium transporter [Nitrospirae bacterium]|nr:ammonium transporter [Nitrospirota bacterium]MBI5695762.1 ammonium transporter [Nitrospirota bacterium]